MRHIRLTCCLLLILLLGANGLPVARAQENQPLFLPVILGSTLLVTTVDDELNSDGDCSLREAIVAANRDSVVDNCHADKNTRTIFLPTGTYLLSIEGAHEDAAASGDLDISDDLTILGTGPVTTVIDGQELDRVFQVLAKSKVSLRDLTIQHGKTADGASSTSAKGEDAENGGGLANEGDLTLINALLINNATGHGGDGKPGDPAVGERGGNGGNGGGLYNSGTVTILNSTFAENSTGDGGANGFNACTGGASGAGGGLANGRLGTLHLVNSTIRKNQTGLGSLCRSPGVVAGGTGGEGGGFWNAGTAVVEASTLYDNLAGNGGSLDGTSGFGGTGGRGAGIANSGELQLSNSTLSNNQTGKGGNAGRGGNGGNGGGLVNLGILTLNNTTISNNRTGRGGIGVTPLYNGSAGSGAGLQNFANAEDFILKNSLIAGNSSAKAAPDCLGALTSAGYNLIGNVNGCQLNGDLTGNLNGSDPKLGALADNGGPTWTHALQTGSAAIDTGACSGNDGARVAVDQRGIARPQGAGCDIGAYEAQ